MASYEVDEIILEGWFKKHSAKGKKLKKPLGKKAKRRWFCLTERYLDYYTAPRTKRKGTIPVDQLYIRRHDPYTLVVGSYGGKEMKITYDGSNNPAGKTDEWYQGIQDASEAAKLKYGKGGKKKPAQNQNASGNTSGQGSGDGALVEYVAPEQLEEGVIKCGKCGNEIEVDPGTGPVVRCPYCHEVVSSLTGIVAPPEPQQQPQQQRQMQQAPQQQQAPPPQQQQYNQPPPQQQQQQYYPPQQQQQQYAPQQQQIVQQQPMATQVYQQQPQQQVVYQQPAPVYQQQPVVHTQRIVQAGMPPPVYAAPAVTTTTYISNQPQVFVQPAVQYGTTTIVQQPTSTTYTYY